MVGWIVVDEDLPAWFSCAQKSRARAWGSALRVRGSGCGQVAMDAQDLLREISEYCRRTRLAESTFGRRAVNDGKLAARLRNGGRITTETLDRIHRFMAADPPPGPRPPTLRAPP